MYFTVSDLYRNSVAPREYRGLLLIKADPLSRVNFLVSISATVILLMQKIFDCIAHIGAFVVTCGLNEGIRISLWDHFRTLPVYIAAVPVGILGMICPETVNKTILQLPFQHSRV